MIKIKINGLVCFCDKCKNEFELISDNLKEIEIDAHNVLIANNINNITDEKIYLKILTCPHCNDEYCVQVDNDVTLDCLRKQMKINAVLAKKKMENRKTQKQERKLIQISTLLIKLRKELEYKYNNSVYYFQNQNKKIKIHEPVMMVKKQEEIAEVKSK